MKRGEGARPAVDAQTGPTLDTQGKPALDTQGEPALDTQGKPALDTQGEPAMDERSGPSIEKRTQIDTRGAARGRCPERPSKPSAARPSRREGSTPSPLRDAPMTIGTAGHVDHGKTALVAALTGVDTDRLPEEKARGLSIALGYAPLCLPSGRRVSLIDVPGHERFVRTMVAGATGVDAFLMTVAADDGVMPQTVEHAQVLAALGVRTGVVAVTKSDLADPSRACREAEELLPGCEVIACSARNGAGILELAAALDRLLRRLPSRANARTGMDGRVANDAPDARTSTDGGVANDAPDARTGMDGRVANDAPDARTSTDGCDANSAPDARTDTNGRGASGARDSPARLHIDRVFTVAGRGTVVTGTLWSGAIAVEDTLQLVPSATAVRVRGVEVHGQALARAAAGQRVAVNLRGVKPEQVRRGDVLATAGAIAERTALDCALSLGAVRKGERVQVHHGTRDTPARLHKLDGDVWRVRLERPLLACTGDRIVVRRHAPPQTLGGGIVLDAAPPRRRTRAASPAQVLRPAVDSAAIERVERLLREAGLALVSEGRIDGLPGGDHSAALRELRDDGRAVRVSGRLYAHATAVQEARRHIGELIESRGSATLAQTRDSLGIGRKAAQALLEHLDANRVTRRLPDDRRVLA